MLADNVKSYITLHIIVFIWGFTAILGHLISLSALPLVWYRVLIAIATLTVYFIYRKKSFRVEKGLLLQFFAAGGLIALHWVTFFWAIKVSNISVTLACLSTGAFFASILEPIIYKRKVDVFEVFFGLIVIGALALIFSVEGQYVEGIVLSLIAACLSALFSIVNGNLIKKSEAAVITYYEMVGGLIVVSIILLLTGGFTEDFFTISAVDWGWLLILGVFCTGFAILGSIAVLKYISPFTVMLTINLEPVYGIILALLLFKDSEQMKPAFYVGALMILSTVILNGIVKMRKKRKLVTE